MQPKEQPQSDDGQEPRIDIEAIRWRMRKLGIESDAELARRAGVHPSTLSQILSGQHALSPAVHIAKLAKGLECSIDYIMGRTKEPEPKPDELSRALVELLAVARQLPEFRHSDLIAIAKAFLARQQPAETYFYQTADVLLSLVGHLEDGVGKEEIVELVRAIHAASLARTGGATILPPPAARRPRKPRQKPPQHEN